MPYSKNCRLKAQGIYLEKDIQIILAESDDEGMGRTDLCQGIEPRGTVTEMH